MGEYVQIDDEALDLLRQQILADQEKTAELKRQNDLAEQALKAAQAETQLRHITEPNRLRIALDTNEKVAGLLALSPQIPLFVEGFAEWQKEDARWKERVDEILLLILTGKGNGNRSRVEELKQELHRENNQRLLTQEYENLAELEGQAAQYGQMDTPLKLINAIKKSKGRIAELEEKLT